LSSTNETLFKICATLPYASEDAISPAISRSLIFLYEYRNEFLFQLFRCHIDFYFYLQYLLLYILGLVIRINIFTARKDRRGTVFAFLLRGQKRKIPIASRILYAFARIPVSLTLKGNCKGFLFIQKECCLLFSGLSTENNKKKYTLRPLRLERSVR